MLPVYIITLGIIAEIGYYYLTIYDHLKYTNMLKRRYNLKTTLNLYHTLALWALVNTIFIASLVIGLLHQVLTYRYSLFLLALAICISEECIHKLFDLHDTQIQNEMKIN